MTSRRPMTRSYSGNGRTSSFSEEEGGSSSGRSESRNTYLSNVRPENSYSRYSHYRSARSTLCSVMAQLTEDIQPSFETTLKSKAVSENCNVKFTCVVSGFPAPELKWYKDDMEMDRYCGLPKYEIRRNGKTHTLHIYNCTLDDAAIYQVSASNSKGIVSCSGVLEVGTMNEYKIHQRFFDKLKQKAEKKKKDVEDKGKKDNKENIQKEEQRRSLEHSQRKRSVPPLEEKPVVHNSVAAEQPKDAAESKVIISEGKDTGDITSVNGSLEKESEETLAKKRIKMSDDVDIGAKSNVSGSHMMGNGGENSYDGGIGLAQFLAETLQSESVEENQEEKSREKGTAASSDNKENETEEIKNKFEELEKEETIKEKRIEEELFIDRENKREKQPEMAHTAVHTKLQKSNSPVVKHHNKSQKDHDQHNIQASISSMLHSVKDFFFGKSKKDPLSISHTENEEKDFDIPAVLSEPEPDMPPSFQLQAEHSSEVLKHPAEEAVPMETDKAPEPSESVVQEAKPGVILKSNCEDEDRPPDHKLLPEETGEESIRGADETVEAMEVSVEKESSSAVEEKSSGFQVHTEDEKKDSGIVSVIKEEQTQQKGTDGLLDPKSGKDDPLSQKDKEHSLFKREDSSTPPQNVISVAESHNPEIAPMETLEKKEVRVLKIDRDKPDNKEHQSSYKLSMEEKTEVKSNQQPDMDINNSLIAKISAGFPEDRIELHESETTDQVLSALPVAVANTAEKDNLKQGAKCSSLIQEMNAGFPPSQFSQCLEMGDLKYQREQAPGGGEITDDHQTKTTKISNIEERGETKEEFHCSSAEDVEMNRCNNLKTQEQVTIQADKREESNACLQVETLKDMSPNEEELSKPQTLVVTQDNEDNTIALEDKSNVPHGKNSDHSCNMINIPSIEISTTEEITDVNLSKPGIIPSEECIIPTIKIMEPDVKEGTLPLSILALNKPDLKDLQKHDATHESKAGIQDLGVSDFAGISHTQRGMQHNDELLPKEKNQETTQVTHKHQSSEQLPLLEYASIPVINVLCSDDQESDAISSSGCWGKEKAFETPKESLFTVPPISVTCHESEVELKLPVPTERRETETSVGTQRGTKQCVDENLSQRPEIPQRRKDLKEKTQKENTLTLLGETPAPKVGSSMSPLSKPTEDNIMPETLKQKSPKDGKRESSVSVEDFLKNRPSVERLSSKPPTYPSLSPSSLRKFMSKSALDVDNETTANTPAISVEDRQSDKADEDFSGGSTPTSSLSCESSPRLKRRDSLTLIRSATPEELASGARRKIFIPKREEELEGAVFSVLEGKKESPYMSPSQARRAALLQASTGQKTPPMERRSPLMSRRKVTLEVPKVVEETPTTESATKVEERAAGKKTDPLKAPQVIRKIRGEPFPDASGHLKLWCQFFNVLNDSNIKWFKDEEEILEMKRSGGDESQVALAIVHASSQDCGVYGCSITNEYGTDTTDFLLSKEILSEFLLKEDLEVGEEIEMTPLLFTKGLADSGTWGEKYFGRILTETVHIGEGCTHKASRVKVIYGLDPVFESGSTCIIKVRNPIAYGIKPESTLAERNLDITKQECKVQDMVREYCKIFAAEARVNENFGFSLEVIPRYLIHRPANSVPYATVEADLKGDFGKYCTIDQKGKLFSQNTSELEQKCCTFQHWIHQWTHGNLLVTQLEGVETKITNVKVVTKSKGYQGLTECGSPEVFDQFLTYHQCNYYCGLLGLRALKTDPQQSGKIKSSRSPLLNRKLGSNSPQLQRKGHSPQMSRKANLSPKTARKAHEPEDSCNSGGKQKPVESLSIPELR
ncbi:PREDICTED: alpha-protein kinase 3 isoform X1 [Cyprinodon variegatus]|uniref:alpha-protein kinase 3 isoform X1 n=1 Tax=Cyprinodon variegatus TaxID=28743 RepID=UPI0007425F7A|nr:PREDICTED: alpha-protein kinase 3 isoform X1 [Cyprinodon variegatus]XP_015253689.1 PREDICTED: alpha-protein kinase 3 isoform X1 [Cyprinodon variegatus]